MIISIRVIRENAHLSLIIMRRVGLEDLRSISDQNLLLSVTMISDTICVNIKSSHGRHSLSFQDVSIESEKIRGRCRIYSNFIVRRKRTAHADFSLFLPEIFPLHRYSVRYNGPYKIVIKIRFEIFEEKLFLIRNTI